MKKIFGSLPTGEIIHSYTIKSKNIEAEIINWGATLRRLVSFGTDIIAGFDSMDVYIENPGYLGATVGRVSNRIKNAEFYIDGKKYAVTKNEGSNCLHGGIGLSHRVWCVTSHSESSVSFSYVSPDGEDGFPGELSVAVKYSVTDDALIIDYSATPNKKTPIALTNHAYFNLNGIGSDIKQHKLRIWAERYTELDGENIPTGNHPAVENTPFDFRRLRAIDEGFSQPFLGYDHNFVLSHKEYEFFGGKKLFLAAELENENLKLTAYTDQPGMQLYTANHFGDGPNLKGKIKQVKYGALCLEMQTEPNSVNHGVGIYDANETYTQTCVYKIERKNDK